MEYTFESSLGGLQLESHVGGEVRHDDIGLFPTQSRERFGVKRDDGAWISSAAGFVESTVSLTPRLRMTLGARVDHMQFKVHESFIAENEENSSSVGLDHDLLICCSRSYCRNL